MGASSEEVARVRRSALSACVTCPIYRGLLREATAIAECLHTCELSLSPAPVALSRTLVSGAASRGRASFGSALPRYWILPSQLVP
jgi:hypothetical protein